MTEIPILAPVALTADLPDKGLTRGQLGTVVDDAGRLADIPSLLVEFADDDGKAYAFADVHPDQLVVLHRHRHRAA